MHRKGAKEEYGTKNKGENFWTSNANWNLDPLILPLEKV